mgnify:CR=1 FL=1
MRKLVFIGLLTLLGACSVEASSDGAPAGGFEMQVTARDARGRKQYRYHPAYRASREQVECVSACHRS